MPEQITGNVVTIEAYRHEHIDALFEAVSESIPEVGQYETWCHPGYTRNEATQYVNWWRQAWEEGAGYYFAVVETSTGRLLGSCGLNRSNRTDVLALATGSGAARLDMDLAPTLHVRSFVMDSKN